MLDALTIARSGAPAEAPASAPAFPAFETRFEAETGLLWCRWTPRGAAERAEGVLEHLATIQRIVDGLAAAAEATPPRFLVLEIETPPTERAATLGRLVERIRTGDRVRLARDARASVDGLHASAAAYGRPLVTLALLRGDVVSQAFEAALSCDVIVAERGTRLGFPETRLNLAPGLAAYGLLSRRVGAAQAETILGDGRLRDAEALQALGLVQTVAEAGGGEAAVRAFAERQDRRHNALRAICQAGRAVHPLTWEELERGLDIWVDAALALTIRDLRRIERLARLAKI